MRGIILAGGSGTRLHPLNRIVCKQLLPVFDKPLIYYPLSLLMLAGIRDILLITTPRDVSMFRDLFGDGAELGLRIQYAVQDKPRGLPEAFIIGREFIGGEPVVMVLGDNIFYGDSFINTHVLPAVNSGAPHIFAYAVRDPERYGVVEVDTAGRIVSLEEKPQKPKSSLAVTGIYVFNGDVADVAAACKPSVRGETEILDIVRHYLQDGSLRVDVLSRGIAWLDTGTHESMLEAAHFVQTIEKRQGLKIACLEEIALLKHFITLDGFRSLVERSHGPYREYLDRVLASMQRA